MNFFTSQEFEGRLERIKQAMEKQRLDMLIVSSPEDILYVTGFDCCAYYQFQAAIVVPDRDEPILLIRNLDESLARDDAWTTDIHTFRLETEDPVGVLASLLRDLGAEHKRIGVQKTSWFINIADFERLSYKLPVSQWADASDVVGRVRLVKSAEEIEAMRQAAKLSVVGVEAAIAALQAGVTEAQVTAAAHTAMIEAGSDFFTLPVMIGFGERSRYVHGVHSNRPLHPGEHAVFELSGVWHRYNANLMRTASLGASPPEVAKAYDTLLRAWEAGVAAVRPGVRVWEVDRAARRVTEAAGYGANHLHRTSYGVGLGYPPAWIEPLSAQGSDEQLLEPGMTITCEPTLYVGDIGVRIGDTILVTPDGAEVLTETDRTLRVV